MSKRRRLNRANRLNNPGCVRTGDSITYVDMDGNIKVLKPKGQDSGKYAIFETPEEGVLQLSLTLDRYEKSGRNTVRKIMQIYAPARDGNDTSGYVAMICKQLGVKPDTVLDLSNPKQKEALMRAIAKKEGAFHGDGRYTDEMFYRAARARIIGAKRSRELAPIKGVAPEQASQEISPKLTALLRLASQTFQNVFGSGRSGRG